MKQSGLRFLTSIAAISAIFTSAALAWDAPGHRMITLLALDASSKDLPAFLRDETTRTRIASQSCEPDRWRSISAPALLHTNNPDHYIDLEPLADAGLKLVDLPPLRYDYIAAVTRLRDKHPSAFSPIDTTKDPGKAQFTEGTLPWAISENYAHLQAAFKTLRILDALNDPARAAQLEQARANVISAMGILSHFVGDASQPLHTTKHHHGWVGENPGDYTRRSGFHAEIDGGVIAKLALSYDSLKGKTPALPQVTPADPFAEIIPYIDRSHSKVEPLYALEKTGKLLEPDGRAFIEERLQDGAAMLAALYSAAWTSSTPTDDDVRRFSQFDKWPGAKPTPAAPDSAK